MTGPAVREYAQAVRARYQAGGRQEKKRILDEFCETTGMHRKAVIRLLNWRVGPRAGWGGRPRRYGAEVMEALVKVWQVGDRMCGKLLAAVMADLVEALERHGERPDPRLLKRYDEPRTAYQRLLEAGVLSDEARADLASTLQRLNPADLQRRIDALLRQLWRLGQNEHRLAEDVG